MTHIPIKPMTPHCCHRSATEIQAYRCCWNKFKNSLGPGDQSPPLSLSPLPLSIWILPQDPRRVTR